VTVIEQYPLELDGVVTRVLEAGTGDDVVICLHGAGSRADRWRTALPLLAEAGFHLYAVDFPGHGMAAKPAGYPYGSPRFAAGVVELLDQVGTPGAAILGTSLGGHVAALVALQRPEQVWATVLIGAVGLVGRPAEAAAPGSPIVDGSLAGTRAKLELLVHDHSLITDPWVHEESMVSTSPGAAEARAVLARYLADEQTGDLAGEAYAALGLPTMLLWGAEDRWIPPSVGEATAAVVTHADLHLLPAAGHAPYFERPVAFAELVVPFLQANVAAGVRS